MITFSGVRWIYDSRFDFCRHSSIQCLDSCLSQSYNSIEVIVIDDGSTDQSAAILDDYVQKDSRITAIHKANEGYGKSVNIGIDRARGEWIAILEPDDYTVPYMYGELLRTAQKHAVGLIKSSFYEFRGLEVATDSRTDRP